MITISTTAIIIGAVVILALGGAGGIGGHLVSKKRRNKKSKTAREAILEHNATALNVAVKELAKNSHIAQNKEFVALDRFNYDEEQIADAVQKARAKADNSLSDKKVNRTRTFK